MSFYMSPQVSSLRKSPSTLGTGIRFHSRVDSTVCVQATGPDEGLVTGGAGEGLISCVCPHVTLQVSRLGEGLVTLGAGIRFLSAVSSHVLIQAL